MNVIYKKLVTCKSCSIIDIEACINFIRSGKYKDIVEKIRGLGSSASAADLKRRNLPVIFPCLSFSDDSIGKDEDRSPTGLMQFDVDLKENKEQVAAQPNFIEDLKAKVCARSETIFAFVSPSGGLKFAIKTDFAEYEGEDLTVVNQRFKKVYKHTAKKLSDELNVNFDQACASIHQSMYLSHDPEAYYNACAVPLAVGSPSEVPQECSRQRQEVEDGNEWSYSRIEELLNFVDPSIFYDETLPISFNIIGLLGDAGIELLSGYWQGKSASDVEKLRSMKRSGGMPSMAGLIASVRKHVRAGREEELKAFLSETSSVNKQKARPVDVEFPPLLSVDEGTSKLNEVVQSFFSTGESVYIAGSAGLGKTSAVISALGDLLKDQKVLILVHSYKLASELKAAIDRQYGDGVAVRVPEGKLKACTNERVKTTFTGAGAQIPTEVCVHDCHLRAQCPYILERNHEAQVRIMTHDELINEPSVWTYGYTKDRSEAKTRWQDVVGLKPRKTGWKPDFIVVDENWIKADAIKLGASDPWPCIAAVIGDFAKHGDLEKAIAANADLIRRDQQKLLDKQEQKIDYLTPDQYVKAWSMRQKELQGREVIEYLAEISGPMQSEPRHLSIADGTLTYHRLKDIHQRYKSIPTLFLDATANEKVVRAVLGDIRFETIFVRKSADVTVKMFSNVNLSRNKVQNKGGLEYVSQLIKPYIKDPRKVGLITYKSIDGDKEFSSHLAEALGIPATLKSYFGNLRGLNALENVEQLFVVGRQFLPQSKYESKCQAIFGVSAQARNIEREQVIRKTDGQHEAVHSWIWDDPNIVVIHEHFALSETVQACGRGRMIHGSKKEIIFFGCNSLGEGIEIDEICYDYSHVLPHDQIERIKKIGFVKFSQRELEAFGVTRHKFKAYGDEIIAALEQNGAQSVTLSTRKHRRQRKDALYLVFNWQHLKASKKKKNIEITGSNIKSLDQLSAERPPEYLARNNSNDGFLTCNYLMPNMNMADSADVLTL